MWPYFKRLIWDEGAFIGLIRTVLMVVGLGIESGQVPLPESIPSWIGLAGCGAAMLMRSSVPAKAAEEK